MLHRKAPVRWPWGDLAMAVRWSSHPGVLYKPYGSPKVIVRLPYDFQNIVRLSQGDLTGSMMWPYDVLNIERLPCSGFKAIVRLSYGNRSDLGHRTIIIQSIQTGNLKNNHILTSFWIIYKNSNMIVFIHPHGIGFVLLLFMIINIENRVLVL